MPDLNQQRTITTSNATATIITGDFDDVALDIGRVHLIYTDPPYKGSANATRAYQLLATYSYRLLHDSGSLATIVPHYFVPEFINIMRRSALKYRWLYCMNQENGPHPRMAMGVEVMWKPIFHYVKRAFPQGKGFLRDMVNIVEPEKDIHEWQQSESWADYYIPKLTNPGDTVLDPYVGSGTAGVVAVRNGRNFIGIESDEQVAQEAFDRIWTELSTTTTAHIANIDLFGLLAQNEDEERRSVAA